MPRLTRQQNKQLDDVEHFLNLALAELTNDRTVVTMKSAGTTTVEFHNTSSDQWIAPIRRSPTSTMRCAPSSRCAVTPLRIGAPEATFTVPGTISRPQR